MEESEIVQMAQSYCRVEGRPLKLHSCVAARPSPAPGSPAPGVEAITGTPGEATGRAHDPSPIRKHIDSIILALGGDLSTKPKLEKIDPRLSQATPVKKW